MKNADLFPLVTSRRSFRTLDQPPRSVSHISNAVRWLIVTAVALGLIPVCIPNLWEIVGEIPVFVIVGFSVGMVFAGAAVVFAVLQRAKVQG